MAAFVEKHWLIFVSQHQEAPEIAAQLFEQSVSALQEGAHALGCVPPPLSPPLPPVGAGATPPSALGSVFDVSLPVLGIGSDEESAQAVRPTAPTERARVAEASREKVADFIGGGGTLRWDGSNACLDRLTAVDFEAYNPVISALICLPSVTSSPGDRAAHPRWLKYSVLGVIALGVVLAVPALQTPFFLDDYLHGAMVRGEFPVHRSAFDLYAFVDDGDRQALLDRGLLPWWSHPQITIRFFRPLSSALLFVDHRLFGAHPFPMHVHSLVWWLFAVLSVRSLARRLFPSSRVQLIATAIFALAPCHAVPLAWVANREVLLALTFGSLALRRYADFRSTRALAPAALSLLLFALALFAGGEYALSFAGYVVAIDVVRRRETLVSRLTGWLPFAIPAGVYMAVRGALHYGSHGSGFYADPLHDPTRFFHKAPERLVTLLADGWLSVDSTAWVAPWMRTSLYVIVAVALWCGAVAFRRAIAAQESEQKQNVTWMLIGSLASLTPVLAVVPSTRLLGIAMVGLSMCVAILLEFAWWQDREPGFGRGMTALVAVYLGFAHFIHGPGSMWLKERALRDDARELAWKAGNVAGALPPGSPARVGIVRGSAGMFFAPFALPGGQVPARWNFLAQGGHVLTQRRDDFTLDVATPKHRGLYPEGDLNLYRSEDERLAVGSEVRVPGMRATILELQDGRPSRVRFRFDVPLEELTWFSDQRDGVHVVALPEPGFGAPFDF